MRRARKPVGALALFLGALGIPLAIAVGVGSIWFGYRATNTVDKVADQLAAPVERLDTRIADATEALEESEGSELSARTSGLVDSAERAQSRVSIITDNPLYSRLPVEVGPVTNTLDFVADTANTVDKVANASENATTEARQAAVTQLEGAQTRLDGIDAQIDNTANSLKFWIRISAGASFLLALWVLWSQVLLARHGYNLFRSRPAPTS